MCVCACTLAMRISSNPFGECDRYEELYTIRVIVVGMMGETRKSCSIVVREIPDGIIS